MDDKNKHVDESWKEAAAKEKETLKKEQPKDAAADEFAAPEPTFSFFVTTLALQASIALGIIPNPADEKKEENLPQAKFLIDTISMVKDKTKNNLTKEEGELIESILYELRMNFLARTNKGGAK